MKKLAKYLLSWSLLLGITVSPIYAQTSSTESVSSLISQLQAQIQALKAQIDLLHQAQNQVASSTSSVTGTLQLIRSLKEGMSGDDVKALQAALSADPDIYPEGLISGYFGRLTSNAVKRFQKKLGIEQLGLVGPKTLKELNKLLGINRLKFEDDDSDDDEDDDRNEKKPCALVPPGHLIAPGWNRKHGENREDMMKFFFVRPCRNQNGTSTPPITDNTAPQISNISAIHIASSSAKINWTTNEAATSKVWYATTTPIAISSHTTKAVISGLTKNHTVPLSGLSTSTIYRYIVVSSDVFANSATSSESSFATAP